MPRAFSLIADFPQADRKSSALSSLTLGTRKNAFEKMRRLMIRFVANVDNLPAFFREFCVEEIERVNDEPGCFVELSCLREGACKVSVFVALQGKGAMLMDTPMGGFNGAKLRHRAKVRIGLRCVPSAKPA